VRCEAGIGAALAAVSAACLQIKFSEGLAWCALTAVVVVFVTSWRALATEQTGRLLSYGFAVPLAILVVTLAVHAGRRAGLVLKLGIVAYVLLLLEFGFKHGFTRHDVGHEPTFFIVASCLLLALAATTRAPLRVTAVASAALFAFSATPQAFNAFGARGAWYSSLSTLIDPAYQTKQLADARRQARGNCRLPATMLSQAAGHPVQVDVWETSAVWAYSLEWRPVPVFQLLSAYTPYLDDLNARAITEAPDDQVVLRQALRTMDDHNPRWKTPSYLMALACNYRVSSNEGTWSMLVHARNRCSAPRSLGSSRVKAGQPVPVPQAGPHELLVARFTPAPRGVAGKVQQALLKDWTKLQVTADRSRFRLPEGLAGGPLMISIPAELGWPAPFDADSYRNLEFNKAGTLAFEVVQLRWPVRTGAFGHYSRPSGPGPSGSTAGRPPWPARSTG
jgi:hypothetical protein